MVDIIKLYSKFVVNHPFLVIFIAFLITAGGFSIYDQLSNYSPSVDEILPADLEVTQGLKKLSANLGGGESTAFMVVVELEPVLGSQITDIRDPEIIRYLDIIGKQILRVEDVTGVNGLATTYYDLNDGRRINSLQESKQIYENSSVLFSRIVNEKYSLSIMRVFANEGYDVDELVKEVNKILDNTDKPVGISVKLAGESIANKISEDLTGPDSAKTTMISLAAIVLILFITFRSPIYTLLPLFTIIFGVLWTLAFMALVGIQMSSFTAGAISMIVGIGIDFGIQTIMRYRQELASANPVLALEHTLENVLYPMFITTVAAFIGFWSMTLGDFLILGELGKIMALGVVFCFLAASTVVPAISVLYEKYVPKKKLNSPFKIIKRFFLLIIGKAKI